MICWKLKWKIFLSNCFSMQKKTIRKFDKSILQCSNCKEYINSSDSCINAYIFGQSVYFVIRPGCLWTSAYTLKLYYQIHPALCSAGCIRSMYRLKFINGPAYSLLKYSIYVSLFGSTFFYSYFRCNVVFPSWKLVIVLYGKDSKIVLSPLYGRFSDSLD